MTLDTIVLGLGAMGSSVGGAGSANSPGFPVITRSVFLRAIIDSGSNERPSPRRNTMTTLSWRFCKRKYVRRVGIGGAPPFSLDLRTPGGKMAGFAPGSRTAS